MYTTPSRGQMAWMKLIQTTFTTIRTLPPSPTTPTPQSPRAHRCQSHLRRRNYPKHRPRPITLQRLERHQCNRLAIVSISRSFYTHACIVGLTRLPGFNCKILRLVVQHHIQNRLYLKRLDRQRPGNEVSFKYILKGRSWTMKNGPAVSGRSGAVLPYIKKHLGPKGLRG